MGYFIYPFVLVLRPGLQYYHLIIPIVEDIDDVPQVSVPPMELGSDFYFWSFLHGAKIVENFYKSFHSALFTNSSQGTTVIGTSVAWDT